MYRVLPTFVVKPNENVADVSNYREVKHIYHDDEFVEPAQDYGITVMPPCETWTPQTPLENFLVRLSEQLNALIQV